MIAFAIGHIYTSEPYTDPRLLKWFADYGLNQDGQWLSEGVSLHSCTEEEMARFYDPDDISAIRVETMKQKGAFQCLDWDTVDIKLQGLEVEDGFRYLDVNVLPCHFQETQIGGAKDYIRDDCITNRTAVIEQLDDLAIFTLYNYGKFVHEGFGENRIEKRSRLEMKRVDKEKPHYFPTSVQLFELEDETEFI